MIGLHTRIIYRGPDCIAIPAVGASVVHGSFVQTAQGTSSVADDMGMKTTVIASSLYAILFPLVVWRVSELLLT